MHYSRAMTYSARTVDIPVGTLTFEVTISGPRDGTPVMLLHGFPESAESWATVASHLHSAGFQTIIPNQRGYSPAARPNGIDNYRIDHLVDDVLGLLNALEINTIHLVGHDWGAVVGWFLAARHPDKLTTFTAVSSPHPAAFGWAAVHDADQQKRSSYFRLFRTPIEAEESLLGHGGSAFRSFFGDAVNPEVIDRYLARQSSPGALTASLNWYRAMTRDFADLGPVTVPTTYIWSTDDAFLGYAGAVRCGEHVTADYELAVVEGASHWLPEQEPEFVASAIKKRIGGC